MERVRQQPSAGFYFTVDSFFFLDAISPVTVNYSADFQKSSSNYYTLSYLLILMNSVMSLEITKLFQMICYHQLKNINGKILSSMITVATFIPPYFSAFLCYQRVKDAF